MSRFTRWWSRRRREATEDQGAVGQGAAPHDGLVVAGGMDQLLVMSAQAGNTSAMCRLGDELMRQGKAAEAEGWFRKAADAGDLYGMNNLGYVLYQQGDLAQAELWLEKAARGGHQEAKDNLDYLRARRDNTDA